MADAPQTTTARDILTALQKQKVRSKFGSEVNEMSYAAGLGVSMDECYPGIYIGDLGAAKNKMYLKKLGITHVLNTAQGCKFATVDTDAKYYKDVDMKYMGLKLLDFPSANITQYFDSGANFIEDALSSGGKILVHCFMGISRSATIACAYLMIKKKMSAVEAIQTLRQHRAIYPNDGFLQQLADLDNKLKKEQSQL